LIVLVEGTYIHETHSAFVVVFFYETVMAFCSSKRETIF